MLAQEVDGNEYIMSTFLHKFNDAQLKYTVSEQEILTTHKACQFFMTSSPDAKSSYAATIKT